MPYASHAPYVRRYAARRKAAGDRSITLWLDLDTIRNLDEVLEGTSRAELIRHRIDDFVEWYWSGGRETFPNHLTREAIGAAGDRCVTVWLDQKTVSDLDDVREGTSRAALIRYLVHRCIQWHRSGRSETFPEFLTRQEIRVEAKWETSAKSKGEAIGFKEIRQPGNDP